MAWLHLSHTQPSTYDIEQVRYDNSKPVKNEAYLLWISCSAPQFTWELSHLVLVYEHKKIVKWTKNKTTFQ